MTFLLAIFFFSPISIRLFMSIVLQQAQQVSTRLIGARLIKMTLIYLTRSYSPFLKIQ